MKDKNYNFEIIKNYRQTRRFIIVKEIRESVFDKIIRAMIGK